MTNYDTQLKGIYKPQSGQFVWCNMKFIIRHCMMGDQRLKIKKSFLQSIMLTDVETTCKVKQETSGGEGK